MQSSTCSTANVTSFMAAYLFAPSRVGRREGEGRRWEEMGGEGGVVCGLRNMIYKYEHRDGKRAGIVGWRKETKRNETKGGNSSVLNRHTLLSPSNIMQVVSKRTPQKEGEEKGSAGEGLKGLWGSAEAYRLPNTAFSSCLLNGSHIASVNPCGAGVKKYGEKPCTWALDYNWRARVCEEKSAVSAR